MPFTAIHKKSGTKINILHYQYPSKQLFEKFRDSYVFICDFCGCEMKIRETHVRRPHFYHLPSQERECRIFDDWHVDREHYNSREHAEGIDVVIRTLRSQHKEYYKDADIDIERKIPMEYRKEGRVADIFITLPSGEQIVHEVQLTKIPLSEIKERTEDYERAGVTQVVWWLGDNAATQEVKSYFYDTTGYCNTLSFSRGHKTDYSMQIES